ncbi:MAG: head decoration protein [Betaproteobacteria bacterium]|nr:head decoration protein [Betaproteobacteria bacterium]
MLAQSESITQTPVQYLGGDTPALATENGTLAAGENLPARAVLGRIAASGKFVLCNPEAKDGSELAVGVLVHAANAVADTPIQIYKGGNFLADGLTWHSSLNTIDKRRAAFDGTGIVIK